MKTQGNFNETAISVANLKEWTAPEIKILDSENTSKGGPKSDATTSSTNS